MFELDGGTGGERKSLLHRLNGEVFGAGVSLSGACEFLAYAEICGNARNQGGRYSIHGQKENCVGTYRKVVPRRSVNFIFGQREADGLRCHIPAIWKRGQKKRKEAEDEESSENDGSYVLRLERKSFSRSNT